MGRYDPTQDDPSANPSSRRRPVPGLVVIFTEGAPAATPVPLRENTLCVGRELPGGVLSGDERISRHHARLTREGRAWSIADLGSKNGTYVDGERIASQTLSERSIIRVGGSLLCLVDDLAPFLESRAPDLGGAIWGPRLQSLRSEIALAARSGNTLLIQGETGAGKEIAAREFHAVAHAAQAPFVAVNCAAIPENLAESLLFGARKGAFSGAVADSDGYIGAAHGGTLFLDEVAELTASVQAKLLRVLETREVQPLGSVHARPVRFHLCAASHASLRRAAAEGRFREDLYFRIGRPVVRLPPLRERLDEVPAFVVSAVRDVDAALSISPQFVEQCCLRAWPGNARELLHEVKRAAHRALSRGKAALDASHLPDDAGVAPVHDEEDAPATQPRPTDAAIEQALLQHDGNVSGAARALGMHRNQLRRWLSKRNSAPQPRSS